MDNWLPDSIACFGKVMFDDYRGDTVLIVSPMMTALAVTQLGEFLPDGRLGYRVVRWIAEATEARAGNILEHFRGIHHSHDEDFEAKVRGEMIALARAFTKKGVEAAQSNKSEVDLVRHAVEISWPLL